MAKSKTAACEPSVVTVGESVMYILGAEDVRRMNETRGPDQRRLEAGEFVRLEITADRGGDCVDGEIRVDGSTLAVERRNRGYGSMQWDWISGGP